jgi:hypothetical protein
MFHDLAQFVTAHRPCGKLTGGVGELESSQGYLVRVSCSCGAAFERWVIPDAVDRDLLRSGLTAFPN